eukprot:c18527_g1_i2.p1 GENE.c18527_g1_i2~~c18527_g1_i2.p1  ORF type:complete len:177 (+),score=44.89 c18527_g1_i2:56-586(+)
MALPHTPALQQELDKFNSSNSQVVPLALDELIVSVARTGVLNYRWSDFKPVLRVKLEERLQRLKRESDDLKKESFEDVRKNLLEIFDLFSGPPFTIQRFCEVLMGLSAPYNSLRKFTGAVERVINVSMIAGSGLSASTSASTTTHTAPDNMTVDLVDPKTPSEETQAMEVDTNPPQ